MVPSAASKREKRLRKERMRGFSRQYDLLQHGSNDLSDKKIIAVFDNRDLFTRKVAVLDTNNRVYADDIVKGDGARIKRRVFATFRLHALRQRLRQTRGYR